MSHALTYDPSACDRFIDDAAWHALADDMERARVETLADVQLLESGAALPPEKQPLDAGFIRLPEYLLAGAEGDLLGRMEQSAARLRDQIDKLVVLGIGGSYMGLRALFEGLCDPYHNQQSRPERGGVPKLFYDGNNLDNDFTSSLLGLLSGAGRAPQNPDDRWGIVVISKSGGTLETAAAFRIYREALEAFYGAKSREARELIVPVTGVSGKLRKLSDQLGYGDRFPIPDGVGGRFSVFTAVGLYPAAVLGIDVRALLQGAAEMTERFRTAPLGENPVLDYVATCHLLERDRGMDLRVLSTWGNRLEATGFWYDQLLAESLGKAERGATPLTVVNTRDLHSRGQQHQEGKRDRVITNVIVDAPASPVVDVPSVPADENQDDLNRLTRRGLPGLLSAAIDGTNQAYADAKRPTADIRLQRLDANTLGQLLQMFMLATVVEGRLIGINPYGQPGVEAYKQNMGKILYS
ncbi:MAG: glucose-6-phosphate isomerase [Planctomycetaceae bacterium]